MSEQPRDRVAARYVVVALIATCAISAWGGYLLWSNHLDQVATVHMTQCRNGLKKTTCTGVWHGTDGTEHWVTTDDGYFQTGDSGQLYLAGDEAFVHWQSPAIPFFLAAGVGFVFVYLLALLWYFERRKRLRGY